MAYSRQLVLYDKEAEQVRALCETLRDQAKARGVYLIDTDGQLIEARGELSELDTTALASLTAAYNASAGGIFRTLGEKIPAMQLLEGEVGSLFFSVVSKILILGVFFDTKTNLGLVRIRTKKVSDELAAFIANKNNLSEEAEDLEASSLVALAPTKDRYNDITDEDIAHLFDD